MQERRTAHSARLRLARVLPIVRGSRSSQVHFRLRQAADSRPSWTSIRLVWTAQRRSIAILKAAVSALSTPGPAPAYPPPHSRARNTKKSTAFSGRFRTDAAERGSVGYAVAWRSSRQDRKRSTAFALKQLTPRTTAPGALGYKSAPSRESGLPPSLPASPAVTDSMAPLTTRSPTESKLAPCASSARHLRSAPLSPLTQPGKAPMTRPLRHGTLPARYRANEEKDYGLRKGLLKAPTAQKTHAASTFNKPLLRLTGKRQAEYSLPHENPYMRASLAGDRTAT